MPLSRIACAIAGQIGTRRSFRLCGACLPDGKPPCRADTYVLSVAGIPCRRANRSNGLQPARLRVLMRSSIGQSIAAFVMVRLEFFSAAGWTPSASPLSQPIARVGLARPRHSRYRSDFRSLSVMSGRYKRLLRRDLGLRQHLLDFHEALDSRPLLEQSLTLNQELSAPLLNPWQPPYLALARRARLDGVRTILTGHGGDEWLCVSPILSADLIRRGAFVELAQFIGTLRRSYKMRPFALARYCLWDCGLRPLGGLALHQLIPKIHKSSSG